MTEKKLEVKNEKKKTVKINTKYPLPSRGISLETQLDLIKSFCRSLQKWEGTS